MLRLSFKIEKWRFSLLLLPLIQGVSMSSYAASTPQVEALKLNDVTVFLQGAELFNSAEINLPVGESDVVFTNVASNINEKTLLIHTEGKALVKSSSIKRNYLADKSQSANVEHLQSQIDELEQSQRQRQIALQVIDAQLQLLEENTRMSGDSNAVHVEDIQSMWRFIDTEMTSALQNKAKLNDELVELDKKLTALRHQIQESQAKNYLPGNQLVVTFYAEQPIKTKINLSYAIQDANWVPTYDVLADGIGKPVSLGYKASIAQNSGISWDNVRLRLSTGNLNQSAQAPTLHPIHLSIYKPAPEPRYIEQETWAMEEMAPPVMMMEKQDAKINSLNDYVVTNVGGVNTTFDISLPYTIPSDAKQHVVSIKEEQLKGDYRYFVIPKVNSDAFLQVQVTDWQKLNLLPGKSNIYFEGSFIGEGYINPQAIQGEAIDFSLGRDRKIIVNRESVSEQKSKPEFFGGNINQKYDYVITVRNTRVEPIKLVVLDQVPVSRDAEISVIDVKFDNDAQLKPETGEVEWTLNMSPESSLKLPLSYTVKYPKDKQVAGL